jgi:hypothetical protein
MSGQENTLDFMNKMLEMQQEFMKNLTQTFSPQPAAPSSPFDMWWSQFPKSGQTEFDDFFKNLSMMGQGLMKNPFEMKQQPISSASDLTDWFNKLNQQLSMFSNMGGSNNPIFDSINQQFRQQLMSPFMMPFMGMGGMQNQYSPFSMGNYVDSPILKLLQNVFNAEEKQAGEQLISSLQRYQNQMMEFNNMMSQVGIDSVSALQEKVKGKEDLDYEKIYQWWMDISQGVFNKLELGDEFRQLQGNLQESEGKLKKDLDVYRNSLAKNLGLVPRSDFDALASEVKSLKKEIKKLK